LPPPHLRQQSRARTTRGIGEEQQQRLVSCPQRCQRQDLSVEPAEAEVRSGGADGEPGGWSGRRRRAHRRIPTATTTGRRSGKLSTTPLLYLGDGDRRVVVASYGGADHHPAWYHNLVAHPAVTVQAGSSVQRMRAEVADPEERARLWPRLVAAFPTYDDYQARTERQITVVVLTPPSRAWGRPRSA
jgi:deazaflavin-dependent oxidoreductase (nitroreductase family)